MLKRLIDIFESIAPQSSKLSDKALFTVMPVPEHSRYFVGKDGKSLACVLVSTSDHTGRPHPPIRLENLDAQFEIRCHLKKASEPQQEGTFTVVRCRDGDRETIRYFLTVCEAVIHMLGNQPTRGQIASAVNRLAAIFQRVRLPPAGSLIGLFGELYLVSCSANPGRALSAWRNDEKARFDFSDGDVRLEVKATSGRNRIHRFSYEQSSPPSGTVAVVASLHAEQTAGGASIRSVMTKIQTRVADRAELVLKLHETVAATLGTSVNRGLSRRYDMRLAESSLQFFWLADVPAIRGPLPAGVSNVQFRSDLTGLTPISIKTLIDRDPVFWDLLPDQAGQFG